MWEERFWAGLTTAVVLLAGTTTGCRDLTFDTASRISDNDMLGGRPRTAIERSEGRFVSHDDDLVPLRDAIAAHASGHLDLFGSLSAAALSGPALWDTWIPRTGPSS